jgi:hypothetical protein
MQEAVFHFNALKYLLQVVMLLVIHEPYGPTHQQEYAKGENDLSSDASLHMQLLGQSSSCPLHVVTGLKRHLSKEQC